MISTRHKGDIYENIARLYLEQQGLVFRTANFPCRYGELDLVMLDPLENQIVFVEVRSRASTEFGEPIETVGQVKAKKLYKAAQVYLQRHFTTEPYWRFDLVGINPCARQQTDQLKFNNIDWLRGVLDEYCDVN